MTGFRLKQDILRAEEQHTEQRLGEMDQATGKLCPLTQLAGGESDFTFCPLPLDVFPDPPACPQLTPLSIEAAELG
ncbi:unnamed protein product [Rangifer tarandus platyrhynchus]|uniref:Uncharacterized protein n=1 Tax=Rangifer tarandus platyrhynchus TaxID=3082113 RepID=A0AC60A9B1_RANTA